MAKRESKKGKGQEEQALNLTPMIDVVFQLIIFFIVTANLDQQQPIEEITLPDSPHAIKQTRKPPEQITIQISKRGSIYIGAGAPYNIKQLRRLLRNTVNDAGREVPVLIRGDIRAKHKSVREVMDVCAGEGLYKIRFAGLVDDGR